MIYFLASISSVLLIGIGMLHFYWAVGGKWAIKSVSPTKGVNEPIKMPGFAITFLVGIIILCVGLMYAVQGNVIQFKTLGKVPYYIVLIFAIIFLIRVIGDFKYVGLFKSIKTTTFAKYDNLIFIPVCLFFSLVGFLLTFLIKSVDFC